MCAFKNFSVAQVSCVSEGFGHCLRGFSVAVSGVWRWWLFSPLPKLPRQRPKFSWDNQWGKCSYHAFLAGWVTYPHSKRQMKSVTLSEQLVNEPGFLMAVHDNQLNMKRKYVYSFLSLFVILIFTTVGIVSDDFWGGKKNAIYFSTAINGIRKWILITKVNYTNNKLIFSYLISNERINGYCLIHFLLLSLMFLCQFLLLCLLFLGVLIHQQCIYGYVPERICSDDLK